MHSREFDSIWLVPMNPLASLFARYCASRVICPETYRATASGPWVSMTDRSRRAVWVIAASTSRSTGTAPRSSRAFAVASRPPAASRSALVAPLVQSRPALVGCARSPPALSTLRRPSGPRPTSRTIPQPTPQYEQTVLTCVVSPLPATPTPVSPSRPGADDHGGGVITTLGVDRYRPVTRQGRRLLPRPHNPPTADVRRGPVTGVGPRRRPRLRGGRAEWLFPQPVERQRGQGRGVDDAAGPDRLGDLGVGEGPVPHVPLGGLAPGLALGEPGREVDVDAVRGEPVRLEQVPEMGQGVGGQAGLLGQLGAGQVGGGARAVVTPAALRELPGAAPGRVAVLLDQPEAVLPARQHQRGVGFVHHAVDAVGAVRVHDRVLADGHPRVAVDLPAAQLSHRSIVPAR